jgi:PHD/YefM family antitoxin component YafN of YafNO toxin-antitoxin module
MADEQRKKAVEWVRRAMPRATSVAEWEKFLEEERELLAGEEVLQALMRRSKEDEGDEPT